MSQLLFPLLLFFIPGMLFILSGIRTFYLGSWLYGHGTKTQGVVVDIVTKGFGRNAGHYPVIYFEAHNGESITQRLKISVGWTTSYKKNQQVTVVYDPDEPKDCEIRSLRRHVLEPIHTILFGLFWMFIGYAAFNGA